MRSCKAVLLRLTFQAVLVGACSCDCDNKAVVVSPVWGRAPTIPYPVLGSCADGALHPCLHSSARGSLLPCGTLLSRGERGCGCVGAGSLLHEVLRALPFTGARRSNSILRGPQGKRLS